MPSQDELVHTNLNSHYPNEWDAFVQKCRETLDVEYATHEEWGSQIAFKDRESWFRGKEIMLQHFEPIKRDLDFSEWFDPFDTDGDEDDEGNLILTPQFRLFVSFVTLE